MLIVTTTNWFLWALCAVLAPLVEGIITDQDPNTRYMCQGTLSDFAACQCREDESELACINAQFVDTDVFLHVNNHYRHLHKVTFHGNNFQDLPDGALFGPHDHNELQVLNISANYIVNLNQFALKGMPNLRVLDLSYNEIVLKEENVDFLSHTPKLRELYLRRAFTTVVNRSQQFDILMRMFANAKLEHLEVLDLSYNYFNTVPHELPCPFPSLKNLDLRQNLLKTLSINTTCLTAIEKVDLSRNHFRELDKAFREQTASYLPDDSLLMKNSFYCDCNSHEYIKWIRSTNKIRDKGSLLCTRASPEEFTGVRLVEVPIQQLDCSKSLTQSSPSTVAPDVSRILATSLSLVVCLLLF
uniref:LRRCT domain-containing protein n=1 Tax=Steinernema glaseri TaxID=37863 RepID=A0A1I7YHA1_9BILA